MQWVYLVIAGLFEVAWAVCLKFSEGFSKTAASAATLAFMVASFYFLSLSLKNIPLGTAYAVWTGIGAAGVAVLGMVLFHEPASPLRILFLILIICGIVGLKISTS